MYNRIDIGHDCYIACASKAELVCPDLNSHIMLTPTEYRIIYYLVNNANTSVQLDAIASYLWGSNYDSDKKDPESIKSYITRIRNKLTKLHPALKESLETNYGYGSYTYRLHSKQPIASKEADIALDAVEIVARYTRLNDDIMYLSEQMDLLVVELEAIQQKIDYVRASKNQIWESIYGAQFDTVYFKFQHIQEEFWEKQAHVKRLKELTLSCDNSTVCYNSILPCGSSKTIACIPAHDVAVHSEALSLAENITEMHKRMAVLAVELDELFCKYISKEFDNNSFNEELNKLILE